MYINIDICMFMMLNRSLLFYDSLSVQLLRIALTVKHRGFPLHFVLQGSTQVDKNNENSLFLCGKVTIMMI